MRVIWTPEAQEDMDNLYEFYCLKSKKAALRQYNSLIDIADLLQTNPYAGKTEPLLDNRPEGFRSLVALKHFKLIYTVFGDDVVIHTVWDCRQNPENLNYKI